MNITIVDYGSGNISSVINSFKEVCKNKCKINVSSDLKIISSSDKIVLPGQGSFKSCIEALNNIKDLNEILKQFVFDKKKPLLGICVGMQMFADVGFEETETKGLGWIPGKVSKINNKNGKFKLPHIGWNEIIITKESNIFKNIENKSHMYFVHSYELTTKQKNCVVATTNYGNQIIVAIVKDNIFGTQFHPEKSQKNGLKILENFLKWKL